MEKRRKRKRVVKAISLYVAACGDNLDALQRLVQQGADVNEKSEVQIINVIACGCVFINNSFTRKVFCLYIVPQQLLN